MARYGPSVRTSLVLGSLCLLSGLATAESDGALWSNSTTIPSTHSVPNPSTLSSISSSATSTTDSDDIGGFVAAGLGLTRSSSSSTVSETTSSSGTTGVDEDPLTHADETSATATAPPKGNYTLSFTGDCWQQWSGYWAANSSASRAWTATSVLETQTYTITEYSYSYTSYPVTGTTTVTVYNGAHPQATYTTVTQLSASYTATSKPTETRTTTYARDEWTSIDLFGNGTLVKPTCTLPSYVPECQAEWEDWIYHKYNTKTIDKPSGCTSNVYDSSQVPSCSGPVASYRSADQKEIDLAIRSPPSCTQASVIGAPCSTLYDAFQRNANYYGHNTEGVVGGGMNWTTYTTTTGNKTNDVATITTNTFFWDPSSTFAPGCTLGCQSCQVNGGTVQLIYWPPASSTWINGNYSAITANASGPVTIETLGTTLTSPTVYVSFDSLYARDSCSFFGKTHYDQIVAITNSANLSSIHGWGRYNGLGASASFNFTDLYVSPVPDYIYQSQPRCASSMAMFDPRRGNRETMPANWTCPRTADYDPILAIPLEVREIDPDWSNCVGGIDGVYDPPIALTPKDSIALPTVPGSNPDDTSEATPAPTPKPTDAPNTSPSEPDKPSKTAMPEGDPEQTSEPEVKPPSFGPDSSDSPSPADEDEPKKTGRPAEPKDDPEEGDKNEDPPSSKPELPAQEGSKDDPPADPKTSDASGESNHGSGDDEPAQPSNRLSILFSALESAKPAETGSPSNQGSSGSQGSDSDEKGSSSNSDSTDEKPAPDSQDSNSPSDPEPFTGNAPSPQDKPSATIISLQGGGSATLHEASGSVVIEQEGLSAGAGHGNVATIGTHVYSAASDGGAIVVDDSATHAVPAAAAAPTKDSNNAAAVWTQEGETFSAVADGSSIVVQGSGITTTLPAGAAATIAGKEVSIPSSGSVLVHGDSTVAFGQNSAGSSDGAATTLVHDGQTIVASPTGSKVVFQQGADEVTLEAGQKTVVNGQTLSVAPSGGSVVVDGSETFALPSAPKPTGDSDSAVTTLVHDGETFTVSATGNNAVFQHGSSKLTISAGQQTIIDGQTLSISPSGGALVLDGSKTYTLPSASPKPTSGPNSAITTLIHDGETFTASATGSDVVFQHGSTKITVSAGQSTVIDGQTLSVLPSGGAVVVDGSETFSLPDVRTEDATGGGGSSTSAVETTSSSSEADASETGSSEESGADDDADSGAAKVVGGVSFGVGVVGWMVVMLLG